MQDTECCSVCREKFDMIRQTPRDIGCGPNHFVCAECLSDCLLFSKRIACFLHGPQEKIMEFRNKTLSDFPIVDLSKIKTKEGQTFCTQHGNIRNAALANFICMECPAKICLDCSQEHRKTGHDIVSVAEISNKKKKIENDIMQRLNAIEDAKLGREKHYEDMKAQIEKSLQDSLQDEAIKCIKEFQSQVTIIKGNILMHLSNVNKTSQKEFVSVEKDLELWRKDVAERVKRYSKEDDKELALRHLYKEQKKLQEQKMEKIEEYEEKVAEIFQKEMKKISINFYPRFSEFIQKELFGELHVIGNDQQGEKGVSFNLQNRYKPFKKDEMIDPRSAGRNQPNQLNANPRSRSKSKGPRDNRGRSGSKNKNKFEENKLSDTKPAGSPVKILNPLAVPSHLNGDRLLGLDHLADSFRRSFEDVRIQLTVKNEGGLTLSTVNKPAITNEIAYAIWQFFSGRPEKELQTINQVDFMCLGLDVSGLSCIGAIISRFKNLSSLSLKLSKSELMKPKDLSKIEEVLPQFARLNSLKISFANWKSMSDKALEIFLRNLSSMEPLKALELDLSGCRKLTDEGIKKGILYLPGLNNLEKLSINLAECPNMTINCAAQLKDHLGYLQKFSLNTGGLSFSSEKGH